MQLKVYLSQMLSNQNIQIYNYIQKNTIGLHKNVLSIYSFQSIKQKIINIFRHLINNPIFIIQEHQMKNQQSEELYIDEEQPAFCAPQKNQIANAIYTKYNKNKQEVISQEEENSIVQQQKFSFKIKNLDTGQQQEIQNQQESDKFDMKISKGVQQISKKTNNQWESFWKGVNQNNQQLTFYSENAMHDEAKKLIQNGSKGYPVIIDFKGLDQWTPLHYACYEGHQDIVQLLLTHGANVNVITKFGRSALHIAALRNYIDVVKRLCQYKININEVDQDGNTALHFACQNGCKQIIQYLLSIYCKIMKNKEGLTPMDDCCDPSLLQIFVQYGYQKHGQYQEYKKISHANKLSLEFIKNKQTLTTDDFIYFKLLGKGSFGQVFLVKKKNTGDKFYAMKVLNKDRVMSKNLKRYALTERNVLSSINHPFMVKLNFAFQNASKLFLVMDYYPGGDLGKLISRKKSLPEDIAKKYVAEIVLAFQALHKNMIVFRDLKPDNVVLDDEGHCRLTDFGLSKQGIYNNTTQSFCGSVAYLAPQILSKQGHSRTVDWYLLGLLLYELIVGLPPYYNTKKQILFQNIKRGPLKIPKTMSNNAKDLIKKLLSRDPSKRLGFTRDSQQIKEHPFFEDINWTDAFNRKFEMPPIQQTKYNLNQSIKVNFNSGSDNKKIDGWTFINHDKQ